MDLFLFISKYKGVYTIENSLKVPKTVLEDFWTETLTKLKKNQKFNVETLIKLNPWFKKG